MTVLVRIGVCADDSYERSMTVLGQRLGNDVKSERFSLERGGFVTLTRAGSGVDVERRDGCLRVRTDGASIIVDLKGGSAELVVSPLTPEQVFWSHAGDDLVIATDLRPFAGSGRRADSEAIGALLAVGSVPAPLSVLAGVERAAPGRRHRWTSPAGTPEVEVVAPIVANDRAGSDLGAAVLRELDATLGALPPTPVVLFSGGVDSGLLAARLAALGRDDAILVHCAVPGAEGETEVARAMAEILRLRLEIVAFDPGAMDSVLDELELDFAYPFADSSTVPTAVLVRAALAQAPNGATLVDGTGADGLLGMAGVHARWMERYSSPRAARRLGAAAYRGLGLYARSTRAEPRLHVQRRTSLYSPPVAAVAARNVLAGIAYDLPATARARLERLVIEQARPLGPDVGPDQQLALLDLVHVCAGEFAAKTWSPARRRGARVMYPFLDWNLVSDVLGRPWPADMVRAVPKAALKTALAEAVPAELVHRRKSGFTPPWRALFGAPAFQQLVGEELNRPGNPVLEVCRPRAIRRLAAAAASGSPLPIKSYGLLWTVAFASRWLGRSGTVG